MPHEDEHGHRHGQQSEAEHHRALDVRNPEQAKTAIRSLMADLLDKREARIRRMFGQIAPWYDFLNHLLSLNIDRRWRDRTARLVPPGPASLGPILGGTIAALLYDLGVLKRPA